MSAPDTRPASSKASICIVTAAEGAMFDGHFPDLPIVPGARLLDLIATAMGLDGAFEATTVKFIEPVGPATALTITWQADAAGRLAFDCRTGAERRVAHGMLRPL